MKQLVLLFLIIVYSFLLVSCSSQHDDMEIVLNQVQIYPIENTIKIEKQNFHNCGKISEGRFFCFDLQRGINVDKIEPGQYIWYLMDLYLFDDEDKIIAKYNDVVILCCDEIKMEEFLPAFKDGKALILMVKNNTNKKIKSDIIKSKNILEIYIDKNGNPESVNPIKITDWVM